MSQSEVLRKLWQLHDQGKCACGHLFRRHHQTRACTVKGCKCRRGKWKQIAAALGVDYCNLIKVLAGQIQPGPKLLRALFPDRQVERLYVTHK